MTRSELFAEVRVRLACAACATVAWALVYWIWGPWSLGRLILIALPLAFAWGLTFIALKPERVADGKRQIAE